MPENNDLNLWKFVESEDFRLPVEPAGKKAKSFLQKLFSGFAEKFDEDGTEAIQTELKNAPRSLVDWLAPYPEWHNAANEIYKIIRPWLEDDSIEDFSRVFVAPYGSGLGEIVQLLAENQHWKIISPPNYQQLTNKDSSWLDKLPAKSDEPLVIPRLEIFFLRHYNGLEPIRMLINELFQRQQRCVIGCNSWLWQYLEAAMHIRSGFNKYYYLQSLSAQDLQTFFCALVTRKTYHPTVFRQANNGSFILPPELTGKNRLNPDSMNSDTLTTDFPSVFLKKLAAESRGIPMAAWSIWRNSLKLAPDEDVADLAREVADKDTASATAKTIWVKAFEDVGLPQVPSDMGQCGTFLLLFLLQHDGLAANAIFDLLNFDNDRLIGLLNRLQKSGIIVNENGIWRASWQGYPAIRRFLAEQDHLQDAM